MAAARRAVSVEVLLSERDDRRHQRTEIPTGAKVVADGNPGGRLSAVAGAWRPEIRVSLIERDEPVAVSGGAALPMPPTRISDRRTKRYAGPRAEAYGNPSYGGSGFGR